MTTPEIIPFAEGEAQLDWIGLTDAMAAGHDLPKAEIADSFLYRGNDTLLNRAAWIDGLGLAVKSATIFPGNAEADLPTINGGVSLYSDDAGVLQAIVDFHLVTKWKTAGDSLLAARRLARSDSVVILIVGAGTVARSLVEAYSAAFPEARFLIWNRTGAKAQELADAFGHVTAVADLAEAVGQADIVSCATMSTEPVLEGAWLRPGTHVDLIGAYRPDMREADDAVLTRGRLFVDSFDTTVGHIGELKDPIARGVIREADIVADYYDLGAFVRHSDDEITVFKNGGGAHLDLMVSNYILERWRDR
ncbi:NAD(P)-binding domain-containing protein [Marivita sp. XM-24bin2]|jgi:ornithine cyclodeaminase|uniref:ornithine cyclodeaminase family protein n=1 Tax=unclassified Marivita TaxID=2632480 RepID=UPI000D7AC94A|nr:NAD(P)-binding domain-containing protein [Marivita sp. XM-24bin2]MCR9108341.1 NAD(P)-binding domain-containing protein [Paracoccaceae bacterium]PWL36347.1 MAG: ornithine cyclodeaminase [Marivita sp. XM-24bin2]